MPIKTETLNVRLDFTRCLRETVGGASVDSAPGQRYIKTVEHSQQTKLWPKSKVVPLSELGKYLTIRGRSPRVIGFMISAVS